MRPVQNAHTYQTSYYSSILDALSNNKTSRRSNKAPEKHFLKNGKTCRRQLASTQVAGGNGKTKETNSTNHIINICLELYQPGVSSRTNKQPSPSSGSLCNNYLPPPSLLPPSRCFHSSVAIKYDVVDGPFFAFFEKKST